MVYILGTAIPEGETGHLTGRRLLAELWRRHGSGKLPELALGPMGKPSFVDTPFHFSISHTKRHAFCALGTRPLGLDAEEKDRCVRALTVRRSLSARELAAWEDARDPNALFLRLWVAKEAAVKWSGQGLGDPRQVAIDPLCFQLPAGPRILPLETRQCYLALCLEDEGKEKVTLEILD